MKIQLTLDKEWYTTAEAQSITGKHHWQFKTAIRKGQLIKYKRQASQYLIHVSVLEDILKEKQELADGYFTYQETAVILGRDLTSVKNLVYRGIFRDTKKVGSVAYIAKPEVEAFKRRNDVILSTQEVSEITGLSQHEVRTLILSHFIEADMVNKSKWNVSKESVYSFLRKVKAGYSIKEVCDKLNLDNSDIIRYKQNSLLKIYDIKGIGERILQEDYKKFVDMKDRFLTLTDVSKELGINIDVVRKTFVHKGLITAERVNNLYLVSKDELQRFLKTTQGVKSLYYRKSDYKAYYTEFLDAMKHETEHKETVSLCGDWIQGKSGKTKNKRKKQYVSCILNMIEKLFTVLHKEIWELSDEEIQGIINNKSINMTTKDIELLFEFLAYTKQKRECSFTVEYTVQVVENQSTSAKQERIYSKDEWVAYCTRLVDINAHIETAISNQRYAESWLLLLLHLSLAWRYSDFRKIPSPSLELVGIHDFDWFDSNEFTLEMAQVIINDVRMKTKGIKTDKTNANVHFVIGLTIPTAIALVVCELHKRNLNKAEGLFRTTLRSHDFRNILGQDLPPFSSLKANRTLMTYQFETAVNQEGKAHIAYQLSSYSRAHKQYLDKSNDITSVYLVTTNTDASVENMSLHLFERGFFGWQIGMMLSLISDPKALDLTTKTQLIKQIGSQMSPIMVDSISEYVNTRHEEAEALLKELMSMPVDSIHKKLEEIAQLKSPSLIDFSQCMMGVKNCPYDRSTACLGCKYLIPTNYILEIVNNQLFELLDRLGDTPISNVNKRMKYTHMINQMMYILMDFKRAYQNFDRNYIRSFIDLEALREKYMDLEITKFLQAT